MIKIGTSSKDWMLFFLLMAMIGPSMAQEVTLHGLVRDSATQTVITNASISVKGLRGGARSNGEGRFRIPMTQRAVTVTVTSVGYAPMTLHVDSVPTNELVFSLSRQTQQLRSALVKNKKQRYRNKGNPAVELIREVIDHKNRNRMESYDYATYQKYEK